MLPAPSDRLFLRIASRVARDDCGQPQAQSMNEPRAKAAKLEDFVGDREAHMAIGAGELTG